MKATSRERRSAIYITVGETKYINWRTMLEVASASGMENEEWRRRNCVSIKTFQRYEKMGIVSIMLARTDIKELANDWDVEFRSICRVCFFRGESFSGCQER